jgi:hypothetical protein
MPSFSESKRRKNLKLAPLEYVSSSKCYRTIRKYTHSQDFTKGKLNASPERESVSLFSRFGAQAVRVARNPDPVLKKVERLLLNLMLMQEGSFSIGISAKRVAIKYLSMLQAAETLSVCSSREKKELASLLPERCAFR